MPDHTESFIRALAGEAADRTPTQPFAALHFWIGVTDLDEHEFAAYFDSDPAYWDLNEEEVAAAGAAVTGCGFSMDLGERRLYDDDLLQVMWRPHPVPVQDLVDEAALPSDEIANRIVRACEARGILEANAAFVYADPTQAIRDIDKTYNGLHYIGLFDA